MEVLEKTMLESDFIRISEAVSQTTGEQFFEKLVVSIAQTFEARFCFIGVLENKEKPVITTISSCAGDQILPNITYDLIDTPCANVLDCEACVYPSGIQDLFPKDILLQEMGVESYCGIPIFGSGEYPLGILVILDDKPMKRIISAKHLLTIFANKIGMELERIKYEEKLAFRNLQLSQANDRLLQYAYITSHNLRSPISNLLMFNQLLAMSKPEDVGALVKMMDEPLRKLDAVVRDLNKIVEFNGAIEDQEKEKVNFYDIIENIKGALAKQILDTGANIIAQIADVEYKAIKPYIYSVLYNLISNSIKYRRQEMRPEILINIYQENKNISIVLKDNGLGMDLEKISHQLFQLNKRFHTHVQGSGLGLYMAKKQVELLSGSISLKSTVGVGTVFMIELPIID
jgi:signal transduction histidine kinase